MRSIKPKVTTEKNNKNEVIIALHGAIYSVHVYDQLMNALYTHMLNEKKEGEKEAPILSLEDVTWIDSSVPPLLLSCCRILKDYYGQAIRFIHPKDEYVKAYLWYSHFNSLGAGIVNDSDKIDESRRVLDFDRLEASSFLLSGDPPNRKNYMKLFRAKMNYYTSSDSDNYKYQIEDECFLFVKNSIFSRVLSEKLGDTDELKESQRIISELMCNSIIYSLTDLYVNVQMVNKSRFYFTFSDHGIGFYGSLMKRNENNKSKGISVIDPLESKKHSKYNIKNDYSLIDFYAFFTAIKHPESDLRLNIRWLIQEITRANGTLKVHMNHTMLSFYGTDPFYWQNNDVYSWMDHILETTTLDYTRTPLRIFNNGLKGVHIEVLFEDRKED